MLKVISNMLNSKRRTLSKTIEDYSNKLASDASVNEEEAIKCDLAMIMLSSPKETEKRVRCIQNLARLRSRSSVSLAVNELTALSKKWPQPTSYEWPIIILNVLRKFNSP